MKWKGDTVKLIPPEKTNENRSNKIVVYRTQAVAINHIEIESKNYLVKCTIMN